MRSELYDKAYSLMDSLLSNHLGFNGWVESADGWFPMVMRGKSVSVGKNTLGNSVNASLKTAYALEEELVLDTEGIERAMIFEIRDELKISPEDLDEGPEIIAAYRDLVEGGKPQLLFHINCRLTKDEIDRNFRANVMPKDEEDMVVDGRQLLWINRKMLEKLYITADSIVVEGVKYSMTPSHVAALALLVEYLGCRCAGEDR